MMTLASPSLSIGHNKITGFGDAIDQFTKFLAALGQECEAEVKSTKACPEDLDWPSLPIFNPSCLCASSPASLGATM